MSKKFQQSFANYFLKVYVHKQNGLVFVYIIRFITSKNGFSYKENSIFSIEMLRLDLKVGLSSSEKIFIICFIASPLKMRKNAFYFILKALFILKIIKFLIWLFSHVENMANFKIHDVTTWLTNDYNTRTVFSLISAGPQISASL